MLCNANMLFLLMQHKANWEGRTDMMFGQQVHLDCLGQVVVFLHCKLVIFPQFMVVTRRSQPALTQTSCWIYVNLIIMCLLCTKECLARRPSRLLKSFSTVNGLLHNAWGNSGQGGFGGAGSMPEPLTLTVASNVLFFFSHETPASVWCKWQQWKGQWRSLLVALLPHLTLSVNVHQRACGVCVLYAYKDSIVIGPVTKTHSFTHSHTHDTKHWGVSCVRVQIDVLRVGMRVEGWDLYERATALDRKTEIIKETELQGISWLYGCQWSDVWMVMVGVARESDTR